MTFAPKYLLLGGGYTLTKLAARLNPQDFLITAKSPEKLKAFEASGWQSKSLDILDLAAVKSLFLEYPSLKVLVDSVPPVAQNAKNNRGVENICLCLADSSIEKIIYLSTTGVFGVEDGSWVDEKTPASPNNPRSAARFEAEQLYSKSDKACCFLRIAAIYGPGRGIGISLKKGTYPLIEGRNRWSNRIHVEDLVETLFILLNSSSQRLPNVLCLSDDMPSLNQEVVDFYCKTFSLPMPENISIEEAIKRTMHSLTSNQRVSNRVLKILLKRDLKYPSYKIGASTEFALSL